MRIKHAREVAIVLIVVVAVIALYLTFSPSQCDDFTCFQAHMSKCVPATFINEEEEASWKYEIMGTNDRKCDIDVVLLSAKEGNIDLRQYEGVSMTCSHALGEAGYPEKNLAACHGHLKEGLQAVVIEKLYKYIVVNLGEIRQEVLY